MQDSFAKKANTMNEKANFHNLPSELLCLLVNDWLKWEDVAHWDAAICNNAYRMEWLGILKSNCFVSMISIGHNKFASIIDSWYVARHIRTGNISIAIVDEAATISWLRNTSATLTKIIFDEYAHDRPIISTLALIVSEMCDNLVALSFHHVQLENVHWDIIRNSPQLEVLHLTSIFTREEVLVPADISLPMLQKLSITWELFDSKSMSAFIRRLPELRSLSVDKCFQSDICDCLAGTCPNLIHLELVDLMFESGDALARLLECMGTGLRCLVLPADYYFSSRELQAIVKYHGHSLRCLSISDDQDLEAVLVQIDSFPHLHTLVVTISSLRYLAWNVVNTCVTHLYVNMNGMELKELTADALNHFSAVNTLSLRNFDVNLGEGTVPVLHLPSHIRTVHVDDVRFIPQLFDIIPNVEFGIEGDICIFTTDF